MFDLAMIFGFKKKVHKPLRLMAINEDDLGLVSALLQDAVVRREDMLFEAKQRRFTLKLNRFCHEQGEQKALRAACALQFNGVLKLSKRGIDEAKALSLLHILPTKLDAPNYQMDLLFAGQEKAGIRLDLECIDILLMDLSAPHRARSVPRHQV